MHEGLVLAYPGEQLRQPAQPCDLDMFEEARGDGEGALPFDRVSISPNQELLAGLPLVTVRTLREKGAVVAGPGASVPAGAVSCSVMSVPLAASGVDQ